MTDILGTVLSTVGDAYLKNQGVPITFNSSGQASITGSAPYPVNGAQPATGSDLATAFGLAGGLTPVATSAAPVATSAALSSDVKGVGRWALAFVAFLAAVMFLKPAEAGVLSLTVVLGALFVNGEAAAKAGRKTVIQTVLGG